MMRLGVPELVIIAGVVLCLVVVVLVVVVILVTAGRKKNEAPGAPADERRKCPHCAEWIMVDAKVCRYCGRDV
jgi:hypothetical protein